MLTMVVAPILILSLSTTKLVSIVKAAEIIHMDKYPEPLAQ